MLIDIPEIAPEQVRASFFQVGRVKTRMILKPGQRGTKSLVKKYGDALLCVRFRYDAKTRQRIKTMELIVERTAWKPPKQRYAADTLVPLRIRVEDMPMRQQAKDAAEGGIRKRNCGL